MLPCFVIIITLAVFTQFTYNYSCLYQYSADLSVKRVSFLTMHTFFQCVSATSCCLLPSSVLLHSTLFLCHFLCPGIGAAYKGSSLATRGPSYPIHPLLKHLSFLFSFCFLLGCISVSYVLSSFGELLCRPPCWCV
jgi:hypothetical protein